MEHAEAKEIINDITVFTFILRFAF